jgi:hypothetical protein
VHVETVSANISPAFRRRLATDPVLVVDGEHLRLGGGKLAEELSIGEPVRWMTK